jgi:aspartate/glutamate racemase
MKTLALIHTVSWYANVINDPFGTPFLEDNPDVSIMNIMDDSLLSESLAHGGATKAVINRLIHYIMAAEKAGADVAMVTCTTVGDASRAARSFMSIPVFNIDEPMAKVAVSTGSTLGIIATVPTSAPATRKLLEYEAREIGTELTIKTAINEQAFSFLQQGNIARHDELVKEEIDKMAKEVDAIVLGQISLAQVQHDPPVPMLQVGHSGFAEAKRLLDAIDSTGTKER